MTDETASGETPATQFVHHRRVAFADTDMAGIMHFANYYRYMEEAEHAYFRSLGLGIMHTRDDGVVVGWPRVSCSCSYEAPAMYDDVLEIHLDVERIGMRSLTFQLEFYRNGKRTAKGRMKTACCLCFADHTLESTDIPPSYLDVIKESSHLASGK